MAEVHAEFLKKQQKNHLYYDLAAILYSLMPLDIPAEGVKFPLPMPLAGFEEKFARVEVDLKNVEEARPLNLGDLERISTNLDIADAALEQFLNIATSQYPFFEGK